VLTPNQNISYQPATHQNISYQPATNQNISYQPDHARITKLSSASQSVSYQPTTVPGELSVPTAALWPQKGICCSCCCCCFCCWCWFWLSW
ncbi:unnamed protein product, partial [Polarella glacialis]